MEPTIFQYNQFMFIGRVLSSAVAPYAVRDLNNFLQEVQKPNNLTPYLCYHSEFEREKMGPNYLNIHHGTYTCQSVPYSLLDSTH